MSIIQPEFEYVDRTSTTIRYLEHGWPSELCRWHSHKEYELHLIDDTYGRTFVGDYIGDFTPGTLYLIGPNLPHNWVTDSASCKRVATRDLLIQFSQSTMEHLSTAFVEFKELDPMIELARSGIEFTDFDQQKAKEYMHSIRDSIGTQRILDFLHFLLDLNVHAKKKQLSVMRFVQADEHSNQARIANFVDYISKHYGEHISLDKAADMVAMNVSVFSRNFQKVTGNKFVDFVNRVRIANACSQLYASDEQVSAICYKVGFQNLANFNRQFQRMKQMTPTTYRELARKNLIQSKVKY